MFSIFRYSSFVLLVGLIGYAFINDNISSLIRYDAYPVYLSTERILMTIIALLFAYFCIKKILGGLWGIFTPLNTFVLLFMLLVMPGLLLTPDESDLGKYTFYSFWTAVMLFYFSLLISSYTLKVKRPKIQINKYRKYSSKSLVFLTFIAMFIMSILVLVFTGRISGLVFIKMFSFISENSVDNEIATLRQVGGASGYLQVATNYMMIMIMPISSGFVLINGLITGMRIHIIIGTLMAMVSIAILMSLGGRLSAMFIMLYFLVSYSMVRRIVMSQVITFASVICWLIILQTIAIGRFAVSASEESVIGVMVLSLNRTFERILLIKGYMSQKVTEFFPDYLEYLRGDSYLAAISGQTSNEPSLAQEMFNLIFGGFSGTAGPQAFGEAYANFGLFGMLAFSIFLGFFIALSTRFVIKKLEYDAFRIVFLAYFTVLIARVGYGEFLTFKANGMHILIVFFVAMKLFIVKKKVPVELPRSNIC